MATCLCLRGTSTTSSTINPNNKSDIYKSEINSVTFRVLCVISDYFTSWIHSRLPTMGSSSYVPPIHNHPQPSPDSSMNAMYAGSPGISSVHLVDFLVAPCSS